MKRVMIVMTLTPLFPILPSSFFCQDNYKLRMHSLLYLEEYQQRDDMSR